MPKALLSLALVLFAAISAPAQQPEPAGENILRVEGTDPGSGIHYLRLILLVKDPSQLSVPPEKATPEMLPRFTMECRERQGKRSLYWFLRFDGSPDFAFLPPFKPTSTNPFPPQNPNVEVNMRFEGYIKSKWFKRSWEQLPSGELRYRNSGMNSSNLDDPRYFLAWLTSLPNLHVSLVKPMTNRPRELVFPTKPLLDSMKQEAICQP